MAIVNGSLELGYKNTAWFTANPTLVLKEGQIVYLEQTGTYKIGNGSTQLSALSFLGISSETQTLQNVTDLGNFTTNNIETAGITTDYVQLDTTATTTGAVGKLTWNDVDGTANLGLKGGNVTLQIGQEFLARVVNKTATNISLLESNYQAVRITGAIGQRPKVDLALADNDLNSATTLGLVTETIANNAEGFITTSGQVKEINTTGSLQGETWVDGDTLYLSGTVAGMITNIKPSAPIHTVIIGFVEYAHAIHGKIFVKVNNGYELEELHNVSAIAPNNNEVLTYETSSTLWKPKTVVSALGFTPYNATNPDGYISGITSGMVTTALGFTPYDSANPSGYITSSALTPYAPISNPTFTTAITTPIVNGVSGNLAFNNAVQTSGAITAFTFTKPNNTTQTASTSISGFVVNGGTRQWNTGNITAQSENVWGATTYSFVGPSTITTAYGNVFNAPIAGTNATITNRYAALFNGAIYSDSTNSSIFDNSAGSNFLRVRRTGGTIEAIIAATGSGAFIGSSTAHSLNIQSAGVVRMSFAGVGNGDCTFADGMKWICGSTIGNTFGSANTQKLAFWNATPIVQPANTTSLNGVLETTGLMASGSTSCSIDKPTTISTSATTPLINGVSGNLAFANAVQTSGAITAFTFTKPNNTTQTASTSIVGFNYNGGTRQWLTGNIGTQSENVWGGVTYSFVGASTITNAFGNVFNAPIAGTNATITNNYAAQFNGNLQINGVVDRIAINYPSLSSIYKLGVGGSMVVNGGIVIQEDSGNLSAYSSDGLTQSGGFSFNRYVGVNIYSSNTNPIKLSVNGSENFRMFNGGNILIQNGGTFTNNGFRLDVNGTGRFQNTLTLATGTTTIAPLKLTAGTNLTTPVNGSFEFDGTNLYFTVGGVRKTVTLI